jgi:hypothetical protein
LGIVRGLGSADACCDADLTSLTGADLSTSERLAGISFPRPQALAAAEVEAPGAGVAGEPAEQFEAAARPRGVAVVQPPEAAEAQLPEGAVAKALRFAERNAAVAEVFAALPVVFEVSAQLEGPA